MKQQRFSFLAPHSLALPPAAMSVTLIIYLVLCIGLAFLMLVSPLLGLIGALVINLIVLCFLSSQSRLSLPLYILVAGPSTSLSLFSSGIFSRLYIGNLLFALIVGIWILRTVLPTRKSGRIILAPGLLAPLMGLIAIGLTSIIYSRLFPDPRVSYSFLHSNVSITIVNLSEMSLLVGLPLFLVIASEVLTTVRDVQWVIGAYVAVGMMYAIGTIFAGPLGLSSQEVILGNRRPSVFGSTSSGLGSSLVLFTCIAFGQALYATKGRQRAFWGLLTFLFSIAVIMSFGRESWIDLFLAVLVMVGFRFRNWTVLLTLLIPFLLLFIPGVTNFFDPTKVYGVDRLTIWSDAIAIWQRHPLMGVGAGNYQFFDLTYGTDVAGVAHNQYLEVLAEMGLQGLFCLLWIIAAVGYMTFKHFKIARTNIGKGLALASIGFYISLINTGFFASSFVPSVALAGGTGIFVDLSYRWLLFGLVLSIPKWETEPIESYVTHSDKK